MQAKNFNDNFIFPNLLLALLHGNADAELIFSIVTDVRTEKKEQIESR